MIRLLTTIMPIAGSRPPYFEHSAGQSGRVPAQQCSKSAAARGATSGHFPETVEIELTRYPRLAQLEACMATAGLATLDMVMVEAPLQVTSAQPFRDRASSSPCLIPDDALQAGVQRLERDLASGPIRGDSFCACVWGRKPEG